jgi:hypothetical protein
LFDPDRSYRRGVVHPGGILALDTPTGQCDIETLAG